LEVTVMTIEIKRVEEIKATSIHQDDTTPA